MSCHRGQNALHTLAQYSKDNAGAIFETFQQNLPDFPINALDVNENTGRYKKQIVLFFVVPSIYTLRLTILTLFIHDKYLSYFRLSDLVR